MSNYVRRLVSGNKARFKDDELNVELDLVYFTDHVIIMGFPATGIEGLYRNPREAVKRFLDSRHGDKYRIFNFCPIRENSYPASTFEGRVSRYPFPDHHAPPFAILALASKEMGAWLKRSPEHVVVLHCKAGKGRSGTLACSLLLALDDKPTPPKLRRNYNVSEWADVRAEEVMQKVISENDGASEESDAPSVKSELGPETVAADEVAAEESKEKKGITTTLQLPVALDHVLQLHTSRRMKKTTTRQGVSIASQRRWLRYWSEFLQGVAPPQLPLNPKYTLDSPKARLFSIKVRMGENGGGPKLAVAKVAKMIMDNAPRRASGGEKDRGAGNVWVSLARYEDGMVHELETRAKENSPITYEEDGLTKINDMFQSDQWDNKKMVRSFGRLGSLVGSIPQKERTEEGEIVTHLLYPLPESDWLNVDNSTPDDATTKSVEPHEGIVLEAGREVRIKLYMGQVFMGWIWIIPAYHLSQPPTSENKKVSITLKRSEVDFPLGFGALLIDVEITIGWDVDTAEEEPPREELIGNSEPDLPGVLAAAVNLKTLQASKD